MTLHFNATFHPTWALLGMTKLIMGETLHCHSAILQARLSVRQTGIFRSINSESICIKWTHRQAQTAKCLSTNTFGCHG